MKEEIQRLKELKIYPSIETNNKLKEIDKNASHTNVMNAFDFLGRKEINYDNLSKFIDTKYLPDIAKEQIEIEAKYRIFIEREK